MEKVYHALIAGTVTPDEKGVSGMLNVYDAIASTKIQLYVHPERRILTYSKTLGDASTSRWVNGHTVRLKFCLRLDGMSPIPVLWGPEFKKYPVKKERLKTYYYGKNFSNYFWRLFL